MSGIYCSLRPNSVVVMNATTSIDNFPKLRNLHHGLPAVAALIVVPAFIAMFYATESYLLSAATVAVAVVCILWKWANIGKQLDQFACPMCGAEIGKTARRPWVYPPRKCRNCGQDFLSAEHASHESEK